MKLFTALAALTLIAAPAQAFGTIPCNGAISGFIQVGNQTACFRQLSAEELQASREHAQRVAAERQAMIDAHNAEVRRQRNLRVAKWNKEQLGIAMDNAADNIMQPGGRAKYRQTIEDWTDASVRVYQLQR